MFKKNYDHLPKEVYFGNYKDATRGNPNYFLTYGNGKSAARIQDHLRPNGAHRWHNYMKSPKYVNSVFFYNFFIYWLLFWGEERGDGSNLWHRDWGSGVGANWVTSPLALILSCFRNLMCMHFTINVSKVCACVH